jgi:hypothetical protein
MLAAGFAEVCENVVVDVNGKKLWLNHFPPAKTDGADYKGRRGYVRPEPPGPYDIALCGHMHEKWTVERETVNVGVDRWNNRPITLALIFGALDERCALSEITNIGIGAVQYPAVHDRTTAIDALEARRSRAAARHFNQIEAKR